LFTILNPTSGSAIAEVPRVSDKLHWKWNKWIICSRTNAWPLWNIRLYKAPGQRSFKVIETGTIR